MAASIFQKEKSLKRLYNKGFKDSPWTGISSSKIWTATSQAREVGSIPIARSIENAEPSEGAALFVMLLQVPSFDSSCKDPMVSALRECTHLIRQLDSAFLTVGCSNRSRTFLFQRNCHSKGLYPPLRDLLLCPNLPLPIPNPVLPLRKKRTVLYKGYSAVLAAILSAIVLQDT